MKKKNNKRVHGNQPKEKMIPESVVVADMREFAMKVIQADEASRVMVEELMKKHCHTEEQRKITFFLIANLVACPVDLLPSAVVSYIQDRSSMEELSVGMQIRQRLGVDSPLWLISKCPF